MPRAPEIKSGHVIEIDANQYVVKSVTVSSPSARGAATLYKMIVNEIKTGRKKDVTFKGDDMVSLADYRNCKVSYLYADGDMHTFMDSDDYSQHILSADDLGDQLPWLNEGLEGIMGMMVNDVMVAIVLPQSIDKKIIETSPGIKGASASARTKPATLEGGVVVQVPEYIENGELIKVNTETQKFMSRAKP